MFQLDRVLSFNYPRRELGITGWCCPDDLTGLDELWVAGDTWRVPCLAGIPRADVARSLSRPELRDTGFVCRCPEPRFGERIRFVARQAEAEVIVGLLPPWWATLVAYPERASSDFAAWLRTSEAGFNSASSTATDRLCSLATHPLISVILPTYNTSLYHLHRCIESVTHQLYPNWELCITDDASPDPRVAAYLMTCARTDPRIRVSFAERNGGISAASNLSIAASKGHFIVLLDHDDELHPRALLEVAHAINAEPADLVYSDEDKIDQVGVRSQPAFKPDFDEDLMCAFDYLGHLVAIRTDLVRQAGAFRSETDGAQDWDLLLRVMSLTECERIRHIPKLLYHWRMHEESTSFSLDAKPYAVRSWKPALSHHLRREAVKDIREGLFRGSMRIVRPLPADTGISIVCRACDGAHQAQALRRSRIPSRTAFYELALTGLRPADRPDSNSLLTVADLQSEVTIVFGAGLDVLNHHFIEEIASQALRSDCGVVGPTVLNVDGSVVTAGLACLSDGTYINPFEGLPVHEPGYMGQARVVRAVPAIAPHVFAFRTSRLLDVNGLAALGEDALPQLCDALVHSAHRLSLKVLHTPFAIATLRTVRQPFRPRQSCFPPRCLIVNPNLESFSSVTTLMKAGIR